MPELILATAFSIATLIVVGVALNRLFVGQSLSGKREDSHWYRRLCDSAGKG